ncbi:MAG TPA: indolepyruvate oxidoreductase subunit beta family protein [Gemmatimonadales bacterium]|nr:indolepyruvate oxidoreductase subunit beta family protein [Gemmatimonadales bacterium]
MADAPPRPISILIAALGGQGGGVLTEWLVGAAAHAGYPAQATSIPGVAQRTGATTYYVEVFPQRPGPGSREPVFSLYPTPGDVDVIIASEFLEAGRTLEMDYASPERTLLIASTHRLFAIGEKAVLGDGVFPRERLEEAARKLTRRLIAFDALEVARQARSEVNAVLLGALAATRILPMTPSDFEVAIRQGGVAVERNLAGLESGVEIVESGSDSPPAMKAPRPWAEVRRERAAALGRAGAAFIALADRVEAEFPEALHETLGEAVARLIDYQDARYAELYLERVRRIRALDPGTRLSEIFARRLAVWMAYEDAIRVADLKTRRARYERIRRENGVANGATVVVTDYLKPDLDEIYGIFPAAIGAPIARWAERRWPNGRPTLEQHVRTTSVLGFLRVWGLGRLRFLRPASLRYQRESALMARWERAVLEAAALDYDLGCEVADLASVVKGYGEVRRRLSRQLERVLDELVPAAVAAERESGQGYGRAARSVQDARRRMLEDENAVDVLFPSAARG